MLSSFSFFTSSLHILSPGSRSVLRCLTTGEQQQTAEVQKGGGREVVSSHHSFKMVSSWSGTLPIIIQHHVCRSTFEITAAGDENVNEIV